MRIPRLLALVLVATLTINPVLAQDKVVKKIIELGQTDNKVMEHEDFISNRIGGRIVGSDALQYAEKWVAQQLRNWGYEVTVQEVGTINVGFNRGPWFGRMLAEDGMNLHFGTPSYTAGTKGPQKGHVLIAPKNEREFNQMKGTLKGAWVLIDGKSNGMAINLKDTSNVMLAKVAEAGALGFIQSADVPLKILYDRAHCYDITMDSLPTVCDIKLDSQQYDIIYRKAARREDFQLEFDIRNHFVEGPVPYHNIIAVMKGSKNPDEYVIAGGHLDAFDGGTGSVDDAQGTSVALEAARLLAMSGAKPRRSIMFCIWTAEEFGLVGSRYFVENKTVPLEKISNYFNRDGGPEVVSSITVTEAMYDDFVKASDAIKDINPKFPFTVNKRTSEPGPRPTTAGGSDHAYFAMNGVPTFEFRLNDALGTNFSYGEIWHTERDLFNKITPEYLEHSALVTAVVMYNIANLDHLLSREGLYNN